MIFIFYLLLLPVLLYANPVDDWNILEKKVRDQKIEKDSARIEFNTSYKRIKKYSSHYQFDEVSKWLFPLKGYSLKDVGKGGFKPDIYYGSSPIKGYNFYDGNLHGGHPAYDIFIHDKNRDCLDDNTEKSVYIISPVDLLILSTFKDWDTKSDLRGGNYIWGLDPWTDILYYFAHMDSVYVSKRDFYRAGKPLGTVGRTGKNAFLERSPTHVHLMLLKVDNDKLIPFDYWDFLE